jgi:hypothetical protein
MIVRDGAEQFIDEFERSLHDTITFLQRAVKTDSVVSGSGAIAIVHSRPVCEATNEWFLLYMSKHLKSFRDDCVKILTLMQQ